MPNFDDHKEVLDLLSKAQDADKDNRERGREAHHFLDKRDGQWEPEIVQKMKGRPRYTFDKCNPVVDAIAGEMEKADFDIRIKPAGGDATKDIAQTLDGLIRNIESMSNAKQIYSHAGRGMITAGMDGWRVVQRWADTDSFDQDLFIEWIPNYLDRVWHDFGSQEQDKSDANWCFVLNEIPKQMYQERWPKGSGLSISNERRDEVYFHKPDGVVVGEFYYRKKEKITLVKMNNGAVYEDNEDFRAVVDELAAAGIIEEARRTRDSHTVFVRKLDGGGWLDDAAETVFNWIPVVPTIANFKLSESKVIYRGAIEKLIDPQRVYNYAKSRQIEEGALAPRQKYWMTLKQAEGFTDTLSTLNTNADPVQFYNPDDQAPGPPQQIGGAQVNPGLQLTSESAAQDLQQASGVFAANLGDNPGLQSGVALERLQNKGDISTIKYFSAQEVAICHTARILVDAIPKVYDATRQVRILNEDGTFDMVMLNEPVFDADTQQMIQLNDVTKGKYDVTCSSGPAFQNRQQETVEALIELGSVDPTIIQTAKDIMLKNIQAPGMDLVAERVRSQLFQAGQIPQEQMTDEEMAQLQAAQQQEQQPDAAMVLAQAELMKAQNQQQELAVSAQEKGLDLQIRQQELALKQQEAQARFGQSQQKLDQDQQKIDLDQIVSMMKMQMEQQKMIIDNMNKQADTLNKLREASGIDTIVGPSNTEAYINQADEIVETQKEEF